MKRRYRGIPILLVVLAPLAARDKPRPRFELSDRCIACHNGLATPSGKDVSIGYDWRASIMANSSRDPYWQASVRRETIDHPESQAAIEDECSVCHMPVARYEARLRGERGRVFAHLPFESDEKNGPRAADGVDCSVCHQISKEKLGTRESFNGGFVVLAPAAKNDHPEYGPFSIAGAHQRIMQTSSGGFVPTEAAHIRQSEVCATCHTLYTEARGPGGKVVGSLPEQMPYQEWLHSDYRQKQSCQECHMPPVAEAVAVTNVFGAPRDGMHRHTFVAANFFMQRMLNRYRDDLEVEAQPQELTAAAEGTVAYLQSRAARVEFLRADVAAGRLTADVSIVNLNGHKLPTAYPSRRAWVHFVVRDRDGKTVFESGALRPDGSIEANDNDADPLRYEPHYSEITSPTQVQIYESILKDAQGRVTTGLLSGVAYAKDNRLLPDGFDKATAEKDIAVLGEAATDPAFRAGGHRLRYTVDLGGAAGPFTVAAELWYQPIGFRWANNLKAYGSAAEPRRFTGYFDSMQSSSAVVLARAAVTR